MVQRETNHDTKTPDEIRDETNSPSASGLVLFRGGSARTPVEGIALVGIVGSLSFVADSAGLVAGFIIVLVWFVLPTVGAFAAGAVVLTGLDLSATPEVTGPPAIALVGLLLLNLLGTGPRRDIVIYLLISVVFGVITVAAIVWTGTTWIAGTILLIAATIGYIVLDLVALSAARSNTDE